MAYDPNFTGRLPKDTFASVLNTDGFSVYNSTGSRLHLFNVTASRAVNSDSASYADNASNMYLSVDATADSHYLVSGIADGGYPGFNGQVIGTARYQASTNTITATNFAGTASQAVSASWAPFTDTAGTTLFTGSTYPITASSAVSASWAPFTDTAGTTLYTASTYPITSSWAGWSATASAVIGNVMMMSYDTSMSIDLTAAMFHTSSLLTGNLYFSASNLGPGKMASIKLTADGTNRNLHYPASWVWLETVPIAISASKTAIVSLVSYGTTDANVVGVFATQL